MGPNEILRSVEDSGYKEEIASMGIGKQSIASIEIALNKNLVRTFKKLQTISDDRLRAVIGIYLYKYDLSNIKTIIRGKFTKISNNEIIGLLSPSINYPQEYFTDLVKKDSISEIIEELEIDVPNDASLAKIENVIDTKYFDKLFELTRMLRGQGQALKKFIEAELDILNLKLILRSKHEKIKINLIHPRTEIKDIAKLENIKEIAAAINKLGFAKLPTDVSEKEIILNAEIELDKGLLKKEALLMHQYPLTVNVILGYLFAKEIEVKNLKILLKGRTLGIEDDIIHKLVVVA